MSEELAPDFVITKGSIKITEIKMLLLTSSSASLLMMLCSATEKAEFRRKSILALQNINNSLNKLVLFVQDIAYLSQTKGTSLVSRCCRCKVTWTPDSSLPRHTL